MSDERSLILNAAVEEFAEVGISSKSLHAVAQRAGLEYRAVRALYTDERGLLSDVLRELTDPLVGAVSVAVQDADTPAELIRQFVGMLDQWLLDHPTYVDLVRQCMVAEHSVLMTLFRHSLYPSEFVERLEKFAAEGQIRQKDVVMVLVIFDSLVFFPHLLGIFLSPEGKPTAPEEFLQRRSKAIMELFEGGLIAVR